MAAQTMKYLLRFLEQKIYTQCQSTQKKLQNRQVSVLYRGSYICAHVLLNLLNELGKRDKNARHAKHFISFSQLV